MFSISFGESFAETQGMRPNGVKGLWHPWPFGKTAAQSSKNFDLFKPIRVELLCLQQF